MTFKVLGHLSETITKVQRNNQNSKSKIWERKLLQALQRKKKKKKQPKWHWELIITPAVCHSNGETDTRCCWELFHYLVQDLQSHEGAPYSTTSLSGINVRHLGAVIHAQKRSAEPVIILFEWWIWKLTPCKFAASFHHLPASLLKLASLEKLRCYVRFF